MKYKVSKGCETGKKLVAVKEKADKTLAAQKTLAEKYGFTQWAQGYWTAWGGISCVIFPEGTKIDTKLWRVADSGYYPKANSKAGKAIIADFDALPTVSKGELNKCVNYKEDMFGNIGVSFSNKDYVLFDVEEKWKVKVPGDCVEITTSEYNKLAK